ncbi:hypothetical protein MTO96_011256 [Rhipicephalus appendiculatus]
MGRNVSYTAGFKLQAVEYALEHGNRAAGRHFGIDEVRVRYWRKQHDKLRATNKERRAFRGPKTGKFPAVEEEALEYVWDLRKEGCVVSHEMIRTHARATARKHGLATTTTRFMRRNGLCLRRCTSLCQRLHPCYEEKVVDFHKFVLRLRRDREFLLSQIGNADQTPINFDMPMGRTVNERGARSVLVKATGAEKQRFTVMLAVTAEGRKLPPYVIFKRKTVPKANFPAGIHIRAQEKEWMSADLMADWAPDSLGTAALLQLIQCPPAHCPSSSSHLEGR